MAANGERGGLSAWLGRLAFPPVIGALLAGGTVLARSKGAFLGLPAPLLAAFVFLYIGMSFAYLSFMKQGMRDAARSVALMGAGLSCVFVSCEMGAHVVIGWAGALLVIAGVVFGLTHIAPKQTKRFAQTDRDLFPDTIGRSEVKAIMSTIIFPAAFLEVDDEGVERVVAGNDPFAAILGRATDKLAGVKFADLIPPDVEEMPVRFADAEWVSHRTSKGRQTMFMLSPTVSVKEPEPSPAQVSSGSLTDAETGLYTTAYMNSKCESDVALCRRYKRQMSVVVFKICFDEKNIVVPSDEVKAVSRAAFGRMLMKELRRSDTACRTGEDEVTVFLPETSQKGAKVVVSRALDMVKKISHLEVPELAQASIEEMTQTFFGDELASLSQVLKELEIAKKRKKR